MNRSSRIKSYLLCSGMSLLKKLQAIKSQIAKEAQIVIDDWEQDDDGLDEELGSGGMCDKVADTITAVIGRIIPEVEFTDGGHEGDDHAFIIVYDDLEAYAVDIPPGVYEIGSGYSWKKIQGVEITPQDIVITRVDRDLVVDW